MVPAEVLCWKQHLAAEQLVDVFIHIYYYLLLFMLILQTIHNVEMWKKQNRDCVHTIINKLIVTVIVVNHCGTFRHKWSTKSISHRLHISSKISYSLICSSSSEALLPPLDISETR